MTNIKIVRRLARGLYEEGTPTHESVPYSTTMFGAYTFADGTPFGVKIE